MFICKMHAVGYHRNVIYSPAVPMNENIIPIPKKYKSASMSSYLIHHKMIPKGYSKTLGIKSYVFEKKMSET